MKRVRLLIIALLMLFIPTFVSAKEVNVYVFYGDGCPHCTDLHNYLDELKKDKDYKNKFKVVYYETWYNEENRELANKVGAYFGTAAKSVPFYVIGDYFNFGFPNPSSTSDEIKTAYKERTDTIKSNIDKCYKALNSDTPTYEDIVGNIADGKINVETTTTTTVNELTTVKQDNKEEKLATKTNTNNIFILAGSLLALVVIVFVIMWIIK